MDHYLLDKYFKGNCTAEEIILVEEWLHKSDPLPPTAFTPKDAILQERALSALQDRMHTKEKAGKRWQVAIAASLLIAVAVALLFYRVNLAGNDPGNNIVWKTTKIPMGRKGKVTLTDGSTIELNGGASIGYPDRFLYGERTIKLLRGDAFFSITKDARHPFIVKTGNNTRIKVLGTRFNVKQNKYASRMEITLLLSEKENLRNCFSQASSFIIHPHLIPSPRH
jgi:transmembrane sensor